MILNIKLDNRMFNHYNLINNQCYSCFFVMNFNNIVSNNELVLDK